MTETSLAHCILFLDRQSGRMLSNCRSAERTISIEIPGDDNEQLQEIIRKRNVHISFRDISLEAVCMKYPGTQSNKVRNDSNCSMNNGNSNITKIVEDGLKVLCTLDECSCSCIYLQDFNECCVVCHSNVHRLCINTFSDIEINKSKPLFCKNFAVQKFLI